MGSSSRESQFKVVIGAVSEQLNTEECCDLIKVPVGGQQQPIRFESWVLSVPVPPRLVLDDLLTACIAGLNSGPIKKISIRF